MYEDGQDDLCQAHGIYAPQCGHCKDEGRRNGPAPKAMQDALDNIYTLVMSNKLDCREKCQHIRMALYKVLGR